MSELLTHSRLRESCISKSGKRVMAMSKLVLGDIFLPVVSSTNTCVLDKYALYLSGFKTGS